VDSTVHISRTLRASSQAIWRALTEDMAAWQADQASGVVELGGHVLLTWPTLGAEADLTAIEVVSPRRLSFSTGSTTVTFTLDGSTLHLSHSGLASGDEAEGTRASWKVALATLDQYLAYHEGRPRQTAWAFQRAHTTAQAAHVYFTDEAALKIWLTRAGSVGNDGSHVDLELGWGERLTGQVLGITSGRDVALSWSERSESALVLRTLPAPFSDSERLLVLTWSCWGHEPDAATVERFESALKRLARVLSHPADA